MDPSAPFAGSIGLLFLSGVPSSDLFTLGVLVIGIASLAAVHGSLAHHLARVADLCRDLEDLYRSRPGGRPDARIRDLERMMSESPVVGPWSELLRRRHELEAKTPEDGAPVRFGDLLDQQPLIPRGVRSNLLESMPLLLASLGIAASLAALAVGLASLEEEGAISPLVGLGLRGAFWGLVLATAAGIASKLLVGTSQELGARLTMLIERSYRVVSPDEVSLRIAEAQLAGQERNSLLLLRLTRDLRESLSAGLGRIETAASTAADAAGSEQRRALECVTQDLASQLQRRLEDQLSSLRTSMDLASSNPNKPTRESEEASRSAAALERAAAAVEHAAAAMARSSAGGPSDVTGVLEHAVEQIEEAQHEAGEGGASADALAGLREEVTQMHEQMVESVMSAQGPAASSPPTAPVAPAPAPTAASAGASTEFARTDGEESRSGYSALLHRYQAPRFSLDELAPELRAFDSEAAIERARSAGVGPGASLTSPPSTPAAPQPAPAPERLETAAEEPSRADSAGPQDSPAAADVEPGPEEGSDEQRLRLAQFLRRR